MWLVLYVLAHHRRTGPAWARRRRGRAVAARGSVAAARRAERRGDGRHVALLLGAAVVWQRWLFLIVVPIGFVVGLRNLQLRESPTATPSEWEREHLTSLITAGVTLHTAFFVFGTSRSLGLDLHGIRGAAAVGHAGADRTASDSLAAEANGLSRRSGVPGPESAVCGQRSADVGLGPQSSVEPSTANREPRICDPRTCRSAGPGTQDLHLSGCRFCPRHRSFVRVRDAQQRASSQARPVSCRPTGRSDPA